MTRDETSELQLKVTMVVPVGFPLVLSSSPSLLVDKFTLGTQLIH